MARRYYDRYEEFRFDGKMKILPFLRIPPKSTDIKVEYKGNSRLDIISDDHYNNPNMGWLILQANPQYGSLESDLPIGEVVRVPFPLRPVLQEIESRINIFIKALWEKGIGVFLIRSQIPNTSTNPCMSDLVWCLSKSVISFALNITSTSL